MLLHNHDSHGGELGLPPGKRLGVEYYRIRKPNGIIFGYRLQLDSSCVQSTYPGYKSRVLT